MSETSNQMTNTRYPRNAVELNEAIEWSGDAESVLFDIEADDIINDVVRDAIDRFQRGHIDLEEFDDILQAEVADEEARNAHNESTL